MGTFEWVLAIAIILGILSQTILILYIFRYLRKLTEVAVDMQAKLNPMLAQARETLALARETAGTTTVEIRACVAAITATTNELTKLSREQALSIKQFLDETTGSARNQVARLERVVEIAAGRIEETTEIAQTSILRPIREISAIVIAVRRALQVLFKPERKQINQVYQDEEMFI